MDKQTQTSIVLIIALYIHNALTQTYKRSHRVEHAYIKTASYIMQANSVPSDPSTYQQHVSKSTIAYNGVTWRLNC